MSAHKEKEYTFICDSIPERSFQFFQDMRNKKEFCDVTFRLGNQEMIYAHRVIITAVIPYLRDLLTVPKEFEDGEGISIPEIDSDAFKCLIEFAYSYKMKINAENVWNLLGAACYLRVEEVREACCDFVGYNLELGNALSARLLASNLNCSEVVKDIDCFVAENFIEMSHRTDFLDCPCDYLEELLGRSDLCVDNEQQVLDALLRWVKNSLAEREILLPEMLSKIRMLHMEPEFLAKLTITEDVIRTSVLCRDLIDESRNYNLFPGLRKQVCSFLTEPRQRIRISDDKNNKNICTMSLGLEYFARYYNLIKGEWHNEKSSSYWDCNGLFANVKNKVYFVWWGDTVEYNPRTNEYGFLRSKSTPNINAAVATFQDKIYLFGGEAGVTVSNAVECFDPEQNQWKRMKPMRTSRFGLSAVPFGNYIYVLGGEDRSVVYDCIERYDPLLDKWRAMSLMLTKRTRASAAVLGGKIYICGGSTIFGSSDVVATAEVYDPIKNLSKIVAHMNFPRQRFFLLPCRGKLYALAGEDSKRKEVLAFDIYDPGSDKWTVGPLVDFVNEISGAVLSSP